MIPAPFQGIVHRFFVGDDDLKRGQIHDFEQPGVPDRGRSLVVPEAHRENRANDLVVAADVIEEINTSVVRTAHKRCNRLNSTCVIFTV